MVDEPSICDTDSAPPPRDATATRIVGIDLFRGMLVVLVILGHFAELTQRGHFLTWFGYGFRMPLFVALTGYLFNLEQARRLTSAALLRKYYDRLILPWFAACAVAVTITGALEWYSPLYVFIRPPYHLWFVPLILVFVFGARLCRMTPAAMLALAIPVSIGSMYVFGVGHDISQYTAWMPDRRYFIYPIYFTLGIWVARRPLPSSRVGALLVAISLIGLVWWSCLYRNFSTESEAAAELLLCVPLIVLFPWLTCVLFDVKLVSAIGRDSLFFYLWHPLAFAMWSATGTSGAALLILSFLSILIAWVLIARLPTLSGVLGVRPARLSARTGVAKPSAAALSETAPR